MALRQCDQAPGQCRRQRGVVRGAGECRDRRPLAIGRQLQQVRRVGKIAPPIAELLIQHRPGELLLLPVAIIRILDRQIFQRRRPVRGKSIVQAEQIAGQDRHRPAVVQNVMQRQQQHVLVAAALEQANADQRSAFEIEDRRRLAADPLLDCGPGVIGRQRGEILDREHDRLGGGDDLFGNAVAMTERRAQRLVTRDQRAEHAGQQRDVEPAGQRERERCVVRRGAGLELIEEPEPFLRERQWQSAVARHRHDPGRHWPVGFAQHFGDALAELGNIRRLEQGAQRQLDRKMRPHLGEHLRREQGVAAEREEIVRHADLVEPQHLRPDRRHGLLRRVARRHVAALAAREVRCREGLAIDLAAQRQRQRVQHHEMRRDHVVRQRASQLLRDCLE